MVSFCFLSPTSQISLNNNSLPTQCSKHRKSKCIFNTSTRTAVNLYQINQQHTLKWATMFSALLYCSSCLSFATTNWLNSGFCAPTKSYSDRHMIRHSWLSDQWGKLASKRTQDKQVSLSLVQIQTVMLIFVRRAMTRETGPLGTKLISGPNWLSSPNPPSTSYQLQYNY